MKNLVEWADVTGSGREVEETLQRGADTHQVHLAASLVEIVDESDEESRAETIEEADIVEIDADTAGFLRRCGAGFPREPLATFFVEIAYDHQHHLVARGRPGVDP